MKSKFHFPNSYLDIEKRQRELENILSNWLMSDALKELICVFGGEKLLSENLSLRAYTKALNEFAEIWDYRKIQASGGERWAISNDAKVIKNEKKILYCAEELGLTSITEPMTEPDYILPLGGARMSNLNRLCMAKHIIDALSLKNKFIVGLSGYRPINDVERDSINSYAIGSATEFDAMCAGIEKAFKVKEYKEEKVSGKNINLWQCKREYLDLYNECKIYSLAAPSTSPSRRANSLDTFEFFIKNFKVAPHSQILLVTSSIYVPYQIMKFAAIAMNCCIDIEAIGSDIFGQTNQKAANYLQEIKGTINAIYNYLELNEENM